MAERRMFAKSIIDSDSFIEMPTSSQALYFHLGMRADDDGVVNNPKTIMRMIGAKNDDMNLLLNKKFVIVLNDQIIVIKHWKINNYIQSDRYTPSKYKKELDKSLILDENHAYKLSMDTECIQNGYKVYTQDSIGKVSIGKVNNIVSKDTLVQKNNSFEMFWKAYPKKDGKANARKAFEKLKVTNEKLELMLKAIEWFKESRQWQEKQGQFIPMASTWLNQQRWEDYTSNEQDYISTTPQKSKEQIEKEDEEMSKWDNVEF